MGLTLSTPNLISLLFSCYVIASIAGYGMFVLPFLITVELLPSEKKTFVSMMINFPFVIGETMMCVIAWLTKDYSTMHLAGYLPLVALFPLWFLLPESPRCSVVTNYSNYSTNCLVGEYSNYSNSKV